LAVTGGNELKAVDIATRVVRTIGGLPLDWHVGAAWNQYGIILIGGSRLRRMPVAGGHVAEVYNPDPEILDQTSPSFLPDGRRFLFAQDSKNPARRGVFLGALDSPQVTRLMPEPANAVVSTRGYLLFGRQGTLFAQRFELETNRLAGDPVSIGSGLGFAGPDTFFDVGGDILVWANDNVTPLSRLTWFDSRGRKLHEIGEVRRYTQLRSHQMDETWRWERRSPESALVCS
jgi:eukaryotic-like serine/threonine-protein kinase